MGRRAAVERLNDGVLHHAHTSNGEQWRLSVHRQRRTTARRRCLAVGSGCPTAQVLTKGRLLPVWRMDLTKPDGGGH
jgi:hypothetical protein